MDSGHRGCDLEPAVAKEIDALDGFLNEESFSDGIQGKEDVGLLRARLEFPTYVRASRLTGGGPLHIPWVARGDKSPAEAVVDGAQDDLLRAVIVQVGKLNGRDVARVPVLPDGLSPAVQEEESARKVDLVVGYDRRLVSGISIQVLCALRMEMS
ncbi:MAG: hypothetical protein JRI84_14105 [Deltaproteobacteria bacterium]|nr:hypothetical protein [Deltaproteobacteria bacterium]